MNLILLEDEKAAAKRMLQLLKELEPDAKIIAVLETVKEAIEWLQSNRAPDLIISDIQLADGVCFDIFNAIHINTPVIFTTAYDAYMLKAFKVNSLDYLLKPIDREELQAAFVKYRSLHVVKYDTIMNQKLLEMIQQLPATANYRSRFLVKQGEKLLSISTDEVAYLRADDKLVFLHTIKGAKHIIDESLNELETVLDPRKFFRVSRTYIAPVETIEKIHSHFNGRLKIELRYCDDKNIFVSKQRAGEFKKWLNK